MHFSSPNNSRTESDDAQPLRYEVAGFIMLCNPLIGSLSLSVVLRKLYSGELGNACALR